MGLRHTLTLHRQGHTKKMCSADAYLATHIKDMSNVASIQEIGLDDQDYLFVRPETTSADEYAYIWRDASGIR